ncbi:MAG: TonB-dependent receptor [Rhodothermales bacterium]
MTLRRRLAVLTLVFNVFLVATVQAQIARIDSVTVMEAELANIVVTATKGAKALQNVSVPTTLISAEAIETQGALRLADLLAEQPGLHLVYDHGAGIQLQGLSSDYTLVLIDGEPIIGRTAGTLDLERLTVSGIDRIEVVRGPSSSLYGSEALAGVINIITKAPTSRWTGSVQSRYQTHGTSDLNIEGETTIGRVGARLYANRYGSEGYDLSSEGIGQTVPRFADYTLGSRFDADLGERTYFTLSTRFNAQDQRDDVGLLNGAELVAFDNEATLRDWSITPGLTHRFASGSKLTTSLYASRYRTDTQTRDATTAALESRAQFNQSFAKAEAQLDLIIGLQHLLTVGGGFIGEGVEADRVAGGSRATQNVFAYAQHEWLPNDWVDVVLSARFDAHTDFAANLSPKAALLLKPNEDLRIRASIGSGFKAPTFQQRYLDFSNAAAGYSVFGSVDAASALRELEAQGRVQAFLRDIDSLDEIEPERSVAFNLGAEMKWGERWTAQVNGFRNHISNLIEAAPVALKTNGQSAFTYFNLSRIVTQGIEAQATFDLNLAWSFMASYQFLDTFDRDVIDDLNAGSLFGRRDGRDYRLARADYGGLMNRSRHSGTVRVQYRNESLGFTAALRGLYRGRYGFGDLNGNLILDDDREYVSGYLLWNVTLTQRLTNSVQLQVGSQNLTNHTDPAYLPSLPGRLLFASLRVGLQ